MRKPIIQLFGGNLASKCVGLAREMMMAALFGTGQAMAAFRVAQSGTLVPVNFFTNEILNSVFIPQYKSLQTESRDKAQSLLWMLFLLFAVLSLFFVIAIWLFAAQGLGVLAPGLDSSTATIARELFLIMALGIPFYLASALLMFLNMANGDFMPMAFRPMIQNIGMIIGGVLAYTSGNLSWLAWGFSLSFVCLTAWSMYRAQGTGALALPTKWNVPDVKVVLDAFWATLRPLLLLPVFLQCNIVIERAVASLIGLSAVSALDYARFVTETMILLVSMPVALAGLSMWSGLKLDVIKSKLSELILLLLLVAVPVSAFLALHSTLVVRVIYARGAFDEGSVAVTSSILLGSAFGLWAQVVGYVLVRGLNAQLRNGAVLRLMAVALVANGIFNLCMYSMLGAMTLGLGNAIYGIVLLAGSLTALGLWRSFLSCIPMIAIGCAGYVCFSYWALPKFASTWVELAVSFVSGLVYWALWIALVPSLRRVVETALFPARRAQSQT